MTDFVYEKMSEKKKTYPPQSCGEVTEYRIPVVKLACANDAARMRPSHAFYSRLRPLVAALQRMVALPVDHMVGGG